DDRVFGPFRRGPWRRKPIPYSVLPQESSHSRPQTSSENSRSEPGHDRAECAAQQTDRSAAAGNDSEGSVRDPDEFERNGPTLFFIAVHSFELQVPMDDISEKIGQVVGVLEASVHSLAANRRMDVAGIPGQEHTSSPES